MNIKVRRAGEKNKKYFNEILQRNKHLAHRKVKVDASLIVENRKNDYDLYPRHVVVGWDSTIVDSKGQQVVFSEENCRDFLKAVGDDAFDELRRFCDDYTNFDKEDVSETAGNSSPA